MPKADTIDCIITIAALYEVGAACSDTELAQFTGLDGGKVKDALERLEKADFVWSQPDGDRRVWWLT